MPRPRPLVGRVQRKATKYDRLLANRSTKLDQRAQAFDQRAAPRQQHIAKLQGQIATRVEARAGLIQNKADLLGQIQGSRFPRIHMIKRAKTRILQVKINSKNRQIARRIKRMARQQRIVDRHETKAMAHAGAIQLLEEDRQALRSPLAEEQQEARAEEEQPEPERAGTEPVAQGREPRIRERTAEERQMTASILRNERARHRRIAGGGGGQQGGAREELAAMQERVRRRRAAAALQGGGAARQQQPARRGPQAGQGAPTTARVAEQARIARQPRLGTRGVPTAQVQDILQQELRNLRQQAARGVQLQPVTQGPPEAIIQEIVLRELRNTARLAAARGQSQPGMPRPPAVAGVQPERRGMVPPRPEYGAGRPKAGARQETRRNLREEGRRRTYTETSRGEINYLRKRKKHNREAGARGRVRQPGAPLTSEGIFE
ncbi:MAG: hypothetical protein NT067_03520 [Candidatus Diapherotrites archaeon]|nr:hypothetical protein [Candidatus Diapherotrites archaeon]